MGNEIDLLVKYPKTKINKSQKLFLNDFGLSNNILGKFL